MSDEYFLEEWERGELEKMMRTCETCQVTYDDTWCWTYCPHERFISNQDARRKDLAFSLTGKALRFEGLEGVFHIQTIDAQGYVTFREMTGTYDPTELKMLPE